MKGVASGANIASVSGEQLFGHGVQPGGLLRTDQGSYLLLNCIGGLRQVACCFMSDKQSAFFHTKLLKADHAMCLYPSIELHSRKDITC